MQAALLRVLQHGEFTRVGGHTPIKVDVRIIAATNRNLAESVNKGTFRLDLFYRLNIINVSLPPLRQRKDDIRELTTHFIQIFSTLFNKPIDTNPEKIIKKLESYEWPGNVRELENVIHRAVLMCNKSTLSNRDISFDMDSTINNVIVNGENEQNHDDELPLKEIVERTEKELINRKLKADRGNVERTAESLKISKAALYDKMKRYGISAKSFR
jgi:transcriptional regulator with PAS, ATPase and Fis domain